MENVHSFATFLTWIDSLGHKLALLAMFCFIMPDVQECCSNYYLNIQIFKYQNFNENRNQKSEFSECLNIITVWRIAAYVFTRCPDYNSEIISLLVEILIWDMDRRSWTFGPIEQQLLNVCLTRQLRARLEVGDQRWLRDCQRHLCHLDHQPLDHCPNSGAGSWHWCSGFMWVSTKSQYL